MSTQKISRFIVIQLVFLANVAQGDSGVPQIEQDVIDAHRAIESGVVELDSKVWRTSGNDRILEYASRRTIYFEREKIRCDTVREYDSPRDSARTYREVSCYTTCYGPRTHIWYDDKESTTGSVTTIILTPLTGDPLYHEFALSPASRVVNPRLLGLVPLTSVDLARAHIEQLFGRPDRESTHIEKTEFEGISCSLVKYIRLDGAQVRIWIAPSLGYSVLRVEMEATPAPDLHYFESVSSEVERVGQTNIWFPVKCIYEKKINDVLHRKEIVRVNVRSFNEPLDSNIFCLAGMDIPDGTIILENSDKNEGRMKYWNGKEITETDSEGYAFDRAQDGDSAGWNFYLISVNCAVLAGLLVLIYLKRRTATG